ncbi:MAG: hypothetical protein LBT40_04120 [Deltaproteobacteria bacterium]|jgi:hypothetical protein|nr:hypothetical protein [Deltaproteobacteria bacterium]
MVDAEDMEAAEDAEHKAEDAEHKEDAEDAEYMEYMEYMEDMEDMEDMEMSGIGWQESRGRQGLWKSHENQAGGRRGSGESRRERKGYARR